MTKTKDKTGKNIAMRETIAHIAARLIAVDGIEDFALAKRKAAHQAGYADTQNLPTNTEVEAALKAYRELYFKDDHRRLLSSLRREALNVMHQLEPLSPYLVGSVLNGNAGRYSDINLHIYSDNAKEVELYLLNRQIAYKHLPARSERAALCVNFYSNDTPVTVTVFPENDVRRSSAKVEGAPLERARIDQLEKLLQSMDEDNRNTQPAAAAG